VTPSQAGRSGSSRVKCGRGARPRRSERPACYRLRVIDRGRVWTPILQATSDVEARERAHVIYPHATVLGVLELHPCDVHDGTLAREERAAVIATLHQRVPEEEAA
jgi:hypothetical protein